MNKKAIAIFSIFIVIFFAAWLLKLSFDRPQETTSFNVYFENSKLDPEISCNKVFSVKRSVAKTKAVGRAAIVALLSGPTPEEVLDGYVTAINKGVTLLGISVDNGVAKVNFSGELGEGVGGSCRVMAIRSQIEETLKQFPTVKEVVISINGESDYILQP